MFKKRNICDIICCLIPIQLLIACFYRNINKLDANALLIMGVIILCFYLKLYFDSKKNLEFYTQLMEENRKFYDVMINRLHSEKYQSFHENISQSFQKFQQELIKHSERKDAMRENQNSINK